MVVCTITSKSFHPGTGALLNSIASSGYTGAIYVAYTDEQPSWSARASDLLKQFEINLEWIKFKSNVLPHYQKVEVIARSFSEVSRENVFYIDSDIIIRKSWDFFEDWVESGIALCSDVKFIGMGERHPMRYYWEQLLQREGFTSRPTKGYANSGFIGLKPEHQDLIEIWRVLINAKSKERGESKAEFKKEHGFITFDQDLLNAAIMATVHPVSLVGHEGMSFDRSLGYMTHSIGKRKPWRKGFFRDLIVSGRPVPLAAREYWRHTQYPIEIASQGEQRLAQLEMGVTAALSRIIAR